MDEKSNDALGGFIALPQIAGLSQEFQDKYSELLNAHTLSEEQAILKDLSQYDKTTEETRIVALVVSHLYLLTSMKHPLKKTCTRILSSMDSAIVVAALSRQLKDLIGKITEREQVTCKGDRFEWLKMEDGYMGILQGLFSNFPHGIEACNLVIDDIFLYALNMFLINIETFESEQIPMEIAQHTLLSATKFLDTLLHHCDTSVNLPKESMKLLINALKVIYNHKIAFNTKAHCGALLVMAVVQCPDTIVKEELDTLSTLLRIPPITSDDYVLTTILQSCRDFTTQICMFSGIVHTCPVEVLFEYIIDATPVVIYIFKRLLHIATKRSSIAPEMLEISRTLVALAPLISNIEMEKLEEKLLSDCWDYIWLHLDHFIDAVRSDTQKLLKMFIGITLEHSINNPEDKANNVYMQMFVSAISEIVAGQNPNFKVLAHISSAMKCESLLTIFPDLPSRLLQSLSNASIAQDVCCAYERLMEQHYKEMPISWTAEWVVPIMPLNYSDDVLPYILRIFNTAFRLHPQVVSLISANTTYTEVELRALMGCIITARNNNLNIRDYIHSNEETTSNGITIFNRKDLEMLVCHKCDEIRLLVLTMFIECQKSTETFTKDELDLLLLFYSHNSVCQSPSFRQSMTALYKKALKRFRDSYYVIQRSIRNEKARGVHAEAETLKKWRSLEMEYMLFLKTFFHQKLIHGLYQQTDHGKRALTLELFIHLKACLPTAIYESQWYARDYIAMLFGAFEDTYETNLIMVRKILLGLPPSSVFPQEEMVAYAESFRRIFLRIAFNNSKPNIPISSTHAILTYIRAPYAFALALIKHSFACDVQDTIAGQQTSPALFVQRLLHMLAEQINNELTVVMQNIHHAAKYVPLSGLLFCLRHLLKEEELDIKYPFIIPEMVLQCLKVVDLSAPIINASAPEGYNPDNANYENSPATPQLVLSYAWRTVKEVSLLFGDLQINNQQVRSIVIENKIIDSISKYFIDLFQLAKHRGAYEQGYVGFSKFAEKVWNSKCDWERLPDQWLKDCLQLIVSTDANLCATRRSAGIPFMIQALLITEPKHRANKSFHLCMLYLLKLAEDYTNENQTPAVHSMNILRALYRHNQLGEVVARYVGRGVKIAIVRFNHSDWAIRNSATLMFSALMMRIFGVQRLKDDEEISIKNKLSLKVFTARYDDLYKFICEKLNEYVALPTENASLYPVLLILGRIYLTFENKHNAKLLENVQMLSQARFRRMHKIRELAAQATIAFEVKSSHITVEPLRNNQINGFLLETKLIMQLKVTKFNRLKLACFKRFFPLLKQPGITFAQSNATLLMEVFILVMKGSPYDEQQSNDYNLLLSYLHTGREPKRISTCTRHQQTKFGLYMLIITKQPHEDAKKVAFITLALMRVLESSDEDMNVYAMNCIQFIGSETMDVELTDLEYEWLRVLSLKVKIAVNAIILKQLLARETFTDLFAILRDRSTAYAAGVCNVLYIYPSIIYTIRPRNLPVKLAPQLILDYLTLQAITINSEIYVVIVRLISRFVHECSTKLQLQILINQLSLFSTYESSTFEERLAVAKFLCENWTLLTDSSLLQEKSHLELWITFIELMSDEEYAVRECCSDTCYKILTNCNTTPPYEDNMKKFPLMPERVNEEILSRLPQFIGTSSALHIYAYLVFQREEVDETPSESIMFEKSRQNTFQASRPFSTQARHYIGKCLWTLHRDLCYEKKTIFLEEHFLLVTTGLLQVILLQEKTEDRVLCASILKKFAKYLETTVVGADSIGKIIAAFKRVFSATLASMRQSNMKTATISEVHEFLMCVLFTCREIVHYSQCACD